MHSLESCQVESSDPQLSITDWFCSTSLNILRLYYSYRIFCLGDISKLMNFKMYNYYSFPKIHASIITCISWASYYPSLSSLLTPIILIFEPAFAMFTFCTVVTLQLHAKWLSADCLLNIHKSDRSPLPSNLTTRNEKHPLVYYHQFFILFYEVFTISYCSPLIFSSYSSASLTERGSRTQWKPRSAVWYGEGGPVQYFYLPRGEDVGMHYRPHLNHDFTSC